MTPGDHSADLERIAEQSGQSPNVVLEMFLERASIRQYEGGLSRELAEAAAIGDTADALGIDRSPVAASKRSARPADATELNVQPGGSCSPVAIGGE